MSVRTRSAAGKIPAAIIVSDRFEFDDHREFRAACRVLLSTKVILIDLGGCTGLDSAAIGMLANLEDAAREAGSEIRIIGCSDTLRQIFELVELEHLLE